MAIDSNSMKQIDITKLGANLQTFIDWGIVVEENGKYYINSVYFPNCSGIVRSADTATSASIMTAASPAEEETTASAADLTAATETLANEIKNDPAQLPESYLTRYKNAETEDAKKSVIESYFADKTYFPDKPESGEIRFGNRASKEDTNGIDMSVVLTEDILLDKNFKPDKNACKDRYDTLYREFETKIDDTLSAAAIADDNKANAWCENAVKYIDEDETLTEEQKKAKKADAENYALQSAKDNKLINEVLDGQYSSLVKELEKDINDRNANANKLAYRDYVLNIQEQMEVAESKNTIVSNMNTLLEKEELTEDDKKQLELYLKQYNNRFSEDPFPKNFNLSEYKSFPEYNKKEVREKLDNLAQILAIEEKMGFDTTQEAAPKITAEQVTQLARAEMAEGITGDKQRRDLENAANNLRTQAEQLRAEGNTKEAKELEKQANEYDKKVKKIQEDKKTNLEKIKTGMAVDQAQYQVEYEAYRQKYDATTVHWNKDKAKKSENIGNNTYLNDYARNLILTDSDIRSYTCDESNENDGDFQTADGKWYKLNSDKYKDYMQSLSNKERNGINSEYDSSYYVNAGEWSDFANKHTKNGENASLKERKQVQEMFEAAGLQVEGDGTKKKRTKKMGNDALDAFGTGALGAFGAELLNSAKSIGVNATITGMVSTVIQGTVGGTVTGTVSGTEYVDFKSVVYENGVPIGNTTTVPVDWSGDYSRYVEFDYEDQVDLSYTNEFNCKVKNKFNWGNVAAGGFIASVVRTGGNLIHYAFGKKTADDYDNTTHNSGRENTGYGTVEEPEPEDKSVEVTIETKETIVIPASRVEKTEDIQCTEFKPSSRKNKDNKLEMQTLANIIMDKYNVKFKSKEYYAILAYVRDINGCTGNQAPKDGIWKLPNEIPASVCEGDIKITDAEVNYWLVDENAQRSTRGGDKKTPKKTTSITIEEQTTTVKKKQTDVWDKKGNSEAVKRKPDEN